MNTEINSSKINKTKVVIVPASIITRFFAIMFDLLVILFIVCNSIEFEDRYFDMFLVVKYNFGTPLVVVVILMGVFGKIFFGIKVVDINGNSSKQKLLIRRVLEILSLICFMQSLIKGFFAINLLIIMLFAIPLFNDKKQTFFDFITQTYVVNKLLTLPPRSRGIPYQWVCLIRYYYTKALKKYASFQGRAIRKEWWSFLLCFALQLLVVPRLLTSFSPKLFCFLIVYCYKYIETIAPFILYTKHTLYFLFLLYFLFHLISFISVSVRRLHDIGYSDYFVLYLTLHSALLPLLYFFRVIIELICLLLHINLGFILNVIKIIYFSPFIVFLFFCAQDGQPFENEYGLPVKPISPRPNQNTNNSKKEN